MKCSNCGELNPNDITQCKKCGKSLSGDTRKPTTTPPPPPPPPPPGYPPYPPPYPYPYSPPQFRPSVYDGLYAQKPEEPRLRFDILPKVLFKPKEAFVDIHNHTTKVQGIIMALVITIIQVVITIIFYTQTGIFSSAVTTSESQFGSNTYFISMAIIGIPLAIIFIVFAGFLSALLSREMGGGRNDADKTIGFFGYGTIVNFAVALIQMVLLYLVLEGRKIDENLFDDPNLFFAYFGVIILLAIILLIWGLWVNGNAVSVANDISVGRGILGYFVAWLITAFITSAISGAFGLIAGLASI